MGKILNKLTIRGFKSIEALEDLELKRVNVLIGANGAGKSNFVDFFRLVRSLASERLQQFVVEQGGADGFFYLGPRHTRRISACLTWADCEYAFSLAPTPIGPAQGGLTLAGEYCRDPAKKGGYVRSFGDEILESDLKLTAITSDESDRLFGVWRKVFETTTSGWTVYHFHDTSVYAPMRREESIHDRDRLRPSAENLAPVLLNLKHSRPEHYANVLDAVRLVAPFFDDFRLDPEDRGGIEKVRLQWTQRGSDFPFQPIQLSDGTLRFICLTTALLQPNLPSTIVIDEPELGLHPYAISLLAGMVRSASARTQVILTTQSPLLVDQFEPDEIIVVGRKGGASTFERLNREALATWLEDYTLGELWQKNVIRGGPTHD